tara:strand:+ start:226 stop:1134 length:909 start_codon:yes stop_codon:yes gene_type:complete
MGNLAINTIESVIRRISGQFHEADIAFTHGTDNAVDEAAYLVFGALNLDHDAAAEVYLMSVNKMQMKMINELVEQRIKSKLPVAYLINQAWFAGLEFFVDERVLVPRSPIAELIINHFNPWLDINSKQHVLDLGTGSGCIAIAMAMYFSHLKVDAIDCSQAALDVAAMNVQRHHIDEKVRLIKSDFFNKLANDKAQYQYDLILSNPPYVDKNEIAMMASEFHHEPIIGLASGDDGLDAVNVIIRESSNYLSENGALIVEVGNSQWALEEKYPNIPFTWLEFEMGGHGVFLLTKEDLDNHNES